MKVDRFFRAIVLILSFGSAGAQATEVTLSHQGLTLNAELELAPGKTLGDGVILMTHAGLAHRGLDAYVYLRGLLKERGYNTLAINLGLGVENRHGMLDCKTIHRHRYADAADEIGAWVAWLKGQGASRIVLFGHSRGGAQTALYAAEHDDKTISAVVLLAPDLQATNNAIAYQQRHKVSLAPVLTRAQQLVQAGKGYTVLEHTGILYCEDARVTADTIVSYYGPDPRLDTPYVVPKIVKPVMIIVAGGDEVVIKSEERFRPLADGQRVRIQVVEGADHFFRFLFADDAVEMVDQFLQETGTRNPAGK